MAEADGFPYHLVLGAARAAGEGLRARFADPGGIKVYEKSRFDVYTDADMRAEDTIYGILRQETPSYAFLLEENGLVGDPGAEFRWTVDPLDGTKNFLHGIPLYAVSIALERRIGGAWQAIAGLTYAPETETVYYAEAGKGAFVESRGTRVPLAMKGPRYAFHRLAHLSALPSPRGAATAAKLRAKGFSFRDFGSTALSLAFMAEDKLDATMLSDVKRWDVAAGLLLVREAGGVVTDGDGGERIEDGGVLLAGNKEAYGDMAG
jgi:myo-inositol-1(or 4)-monophosphatase